MGLFGEKETKEQRQAREEQELLAKFGLENLTDSQDVASVKSILNEMVSTDLMSLAGAKDEVSAGYLSVLVEQNFIIIRQLDRLLRK